MTLETTNFSELFGSASDPAEQPKRKRGRPPKNGTTKDVAITKTAIIDVLNLANLPIAMSPYNAYRLSPAEIDSLADAWYQVIKEYPSVAKYLVVGKKLGVWGNLLFVHYQIIAARSALFVNTNDQHRARGTRPNSGPERNGKDNVGPTATILS